MQGAEGGLNGAKRVGALPGVADRGYQADTDSGPALNGIRRFTG